MSTHEFTFVVDHRVSDQEIEALFDRAEDVTPEREQARTLLGFDRESTSLAHALVSALQDVEAAGLSVGSVRSEDLCPLKEIAARTGRTYESVRLLAPASRGAPGPGSRNLPRSSTVLGLSDRSLRSSWCCQATRCQCQQSGFR